MKKTLLCGLLLLGGLTFAQKSDNVGIGTTKPDASALLDLSSTSKGLLLPRMTEDQRNAIKTPAAGLIIFQTDQAIGTYTYDGTTWQPNARVGGVESALTTVPWNPQGNAIDATDFLGSTNAQPLIFKVNGQSYGSFNPSGGPTNGSIFLGLLAGENIKSSHANVGLGAYALTGQIPTAPLNLNGVNNVAIGNGTLYTNRNGSDNLGVGNSALFANTDGSNNLAIGSNTLRANTAGGGNIAIGRLSLFTNTSGSNNLSLGAYAGYLATGSSNIFIGPGAGANELGDSKLYISNSGTTTPLIGGDFTNNYLKFHTGTASPTASAGFVAIGDFATTTGSSPGAGGINSFPNFVAGSKYRLIVQDGILTEKLKVALRNGSEWADYVFASDYNLMSLEEVEKYTKTNKHLPNVPSADEMATNGLDVSQISKLFMEKIEELTLHIISLNKRIVELENKK